MQHKIAISIINFRTVDLTLNCVRSVLSDLQGIDGRVVIVDNASEDGSIERIEKWIAELPEGTPVQLVRSETNSGFSGGHNQGIAAVEAEYYLVLNSDAIVRPGFFRAILSTADTTPQAGLIAPQIETEDGVVQVSCFRFHSPWSELIRGAQTGLVTRLLKRHVVALDPPPDLANVTWASFACILLRGRMVAEIGAMDEGYFLYFEDAEYCLRARRAGWKIGLAPKAIAIHYRGGSGPVKSLEKARKRLPPYFYASRTRFFRQAHGPLGPLAANFLWAFGRGIAHLRLLAGKHLPVAIEAEARDIWTNFLTPLGSNHAPGD